MTVALNAPKRSGTIRDLRINAFAAVVVLVIEFALGIVVNLYATLPSADSGKSLFAAFAAAVTDGPIALTLHALLGTLLLIGAITAGVRAILAHRTGLISIAGIALVAIVVAWLFGTRFVGSGGNGTSLVMASATGIAILCYVTIIFVASDEATI